MFEDMTYEMIMKRMLVRVPDSLDKREGSVIYNALAPAAVELANMYIGLDWIVEQSFADTQGREYLIRRCAERGIRPEEATKAVLKGVFNMDIPEGSRFSLDLLNYTAVQKMDAGVYRMECEIAGEEGNRHLGALIPINFIQGLTRAELTEVLVPGEDEETTEHLRQRYFDSLNAKAFGGNVQDYKDKVNALPGVGGVKVYPVWNGGGTVKLVLVDAFFNKPSDVLLASVQEAVDPKSGQGKGMGLAPVGHVVTVVPVEERVIDVSTQITFQTGWSWTDIKPYVEVCVEDYLKELRSSWAVSESLVVRVSQIEARLLGLTGILDITGTTLNGSAENLLLGPDVIPVKGEIYGTEAARLLS